ncbi:MAG: hypothetical protein RL685_6404 [Pseudomonadota bacterium]|jgi:inorganic pyrophosphatase
MTRSIRVFIENEAGSDIKNVHDERTLTYLGSKRVARPYPYAYGFVLDTRSDDGDNLDCYLLTDEALSRDEPCRNELRRGDIVECEPIGLLEQTENGEQDHNILAVLVGGPRRVDERAQAQLRDFVLHVFDNLPERSVQAGRFLGVEEAWVLIERCRSAASDP